MIHVSPNWLEQQKLKFRKIASQGNGYNTASVKSMVVLKNAGSLPHSSKRLVHTAHPRQYQMHARNTMNDSTFADRESGSLSDRVVLTQIREFHPNRAWQHVSKLMKGQK